VLFNEPKLLKSPLQATQRAANGVSVLFNEPKLLKLHRLPHSTRVQFEFQCSSTSRNC